MTDPSFDAPDDLDTTPHREYTVVKIDGDGDEQKRADDDPFWACESCGWEGDPDYVGYQCPGCRREIGDDEP